MAVKTSPKSKPARKATKKQPPAKKARVEHDASDESATSDDDAGSPGYEVAEDGSEDEDDVVESVEPESDDLDGSDDEVDESETKKKRKAPAKSAAKPKGKKDGKNTREVQMGDKTAASKEKGAPRAPVHLVSADHCRHLWIPSHHVSHSAFHDGVPQPAPRAQRPRLARRQRYVATPSPRQLNISRVVGLKADSVDRFTNSDAPYRHALLNWNTFINALVPLASEADWTLPQLPSKDLVHRIYRE